MSRESLPRAIAELEPPLSKNLTEELVRFWQDIFEIPFGQFRDMLVGGEREANRDIMFLMREGRKIAGTSHLTISKSDPRLGGLGEVAVAPECRRSGIATTLCARGRVAFRSQGGEALFLATHNPAAARAYSRLGWCKLAGANVMAFISDGDSPEMYLADFFRECGSATIIPGSAAERIPMIPLIVAPHEWQVMDANTGVCSTRYALQRSCMGLYPRYEALACDGQGTWFAAWTDRGQVVGLSTARLNGPDRCRVDGFAHRNAADVWDDLMDAAIVWAVERKTRTCWAEVSAEDESKISRFEAKGFRKVRVGGRFDLDGRQVVSIRLEMVP